MVWHWVVVVTLHSVQIFPHFTRTNKIGYLGYWHPHLLSVETGGASGVTPVWRKRGWWWWQFLRTRGWGENNPNLLPKINKSQVLTLPDSEFNLPFSSATITMNIKYYWWLACSIFTFFQLFRFSLSPPDWWWVTLVPKFSKRCPITSSMLWPIFDVFWDTLSD